MPEKVKPKLNRQVTIANNALHNDELKNYYDDHCKEYTGVFHDTLKDEKGKPLKHGEGENKATYEDGVVYEGSFSKGKWHSWGSLDKGKLTIPYGSDGDGIDHYEGHFFMGCQHG